MVDIVKYSVSLAAVACLAALSVSFVHNKTVRKAADASAAVREAAARRVVPGNGPLVEKRVLLQAGEDSTVCWMSTAGGDTTVVFTVDIRRYPGSIVFAVGVGADGVIKGMRAVGGEGGSCHGDMRNVVARGTIGGGMKKPPGSTEPWFTAQFAGLSVDRPIAVDNIAYEWHALDIGARKLLLERNEVTAITGATRSTRTVADAVTSRAKRILKAVRS